MKRFKLLGGIGTGGMGTVYLARDEGGRPVAIKKQHAHLADDPDAIARFFDEARLAARIEHPNVVRVIDVSITAGDLVLVMEYVEGGSLSMLQQLMPTHARRELHWSESLRILADALRGLHAAHELRDRRGRLLGVVHRDVSPQNLLVGIDGATRVTDFGVARAAGRIRSTQTDGEVAGKLRYLSPEQIQRKTVDRRADIFAAGIVLWECLTAKGLFAAESDGETIAGIVRRPIDPPSTCAHEIPLEVDEICLRALERDPRRRFSNAAEFADALEASGAASRGQIADAVTACMGDELRKRRSMLTVPAPENTPQVEYDPSSTMLLARAKKPSWGALSPGVVVGILVGVLVGGVAVAVLGRSDRPEAVPSRLGSPERTPDSGSTPAPSGASSMAPARTVAP